MKYYTLDAAGNLTSYLDTRTGATSPNTSSGSGSGTGGSTVSVTPKAVLKAGTFWTDTSPMPTSYRNMDEPIVQYGTSHPATMNATCGMNSPGYVSGVQGFINGGTSGVTVYFQVYKNGSPLGLIASGATNNAQGRPSATGGPSYPFVAGDVLSVCIKADQSYVNQSFSATMEVTFTG